MDQAGDPAYILKLNLSTQIQIPDYLIDSKAGRFARKNMWKANKRRTGFSMSREVSMRGDDDWTRRSVGENVRWYSERLSCFSAVRNRKLKQHWFEAENVYPGIKTRR
jgi:hypothetical protein